MADVIEQIKTELGGASAVTDAQLALWVADAQRLIDARARRLGVTSLADEDRGWLTRIAVVAHARNPSGSSKISAAIDDGSFSREVTAGAGRVTIDDDLWAEVGLDEPDLSGGWTGSLRYGGC